jgi:hypothetical protein
MAIHTFSSQMRSDGTKNDPIFSLGEHWLFFEVASSVWDQQS